MDVILAKTFLAIIDCGNFREASDRLHVTQSTVSARIKSLEEQLGKRLFIRNKSGATLTQAGLNFQEYALSFIQLWERALSKVSSESTYQDYICIGARPGLWEPIVMKWLPWAKTEFSQLAFKAEFGVATDLIRKLEEGIVDIALLLSAPSIPGIKVEQLYQEKFLLVTKRDPISKIKNFTKFTEKNYIEVDWGKEFRESKKHYFPASFIPQLSVSFGIYGVKYILEHGGYGYFPYSMISEYIKSGKLMIIEGAPEIGQPVYLSYCQDDHSIFKEPLLTGFREIAAKL